MQVVLHPVVARDVGDLAGNAAQIDATKLALAGLLVNPFEELAELDAGIRSAADPTNVTYLPPLALPLN